MLITVEAHIEASLAQAWEAWTNPKHIIHWNNASDDWHTPRAQNDLRKGGRFNYRMEARDGSFGFDFEGTYTHILPQKSIAYILDDRREVHISFFPTANGVQINETFEAEQTNDAELQKNGWQAILNNFKRYVETME